MDWDKKLPKNQSKVTYLTAKRDDKRTAEAPPNDPIRVADEFDKELDSQKGSEEK
jgi:hypothetical protein